MILLIINCRRILRLICTVFNISSRTRTLISLRNLKAGQEGVYQTQYTDGHVDRRITRQSDIRTCLQLFTMSCSSKPSEISFQLLQTFQRNAHTHSFKVRCLYLNDWSTLLWKQSKNKYNPLGVPQPEKFCTISDYEPHFSPHWKP